MRIAVLGVGLIGGSIGRAARARIDGATVVGFDPDPETVARAVGVGAVNRAAASVVEACEGAEQVVCAAPVSGLVELAREALAASGDDVVVTDVGSTKREIVDALGDDQRFIGGHPLAGAETAGVEHARAGLFDGATWYLTPTSRTEGVLYDRLYRLLANLGARPAAIDAETHDRLMASVSHLPHVLANVLVAQAARALESERLPPTGPSFRDATRVAGANPALWRDILLSNREAVAAELDSFSATLARVGADLRAGDTDALERWIGEARGDRRRLREADVAGGPVTEVRVSVPNRPGIVAQLALAIGDAGVNIVDMALYPAADMQSGAIALWVAGEGSAERAVELIGGLGYVASVVG
jgi:prephenate dehydrogenase